MERLAKIGFNQSYTYFTWRQSSWELRQYFEDLADAHRRLLPAQRLAEHARHPHRAAADGRPGDVRHPGHPRRHAVAGVGRLRPGVRADGAPPGAPGLGGVPRLGEVPAAPVGPPPARQPGPAARPAQPHPPRAAGARPPAHAALPQHRQPGAAVLLEDRSRRRRPAGARRRQPRRPPAPARAGSTSTCSRSGCRTSRAYDVVDQLTDARYRWHGAATSSTSTRRSPPTSSGSRTVS